MLPRDRGVSTYVLILMVAAFLGALVAIFILVQRRGPAPGAGALGAAGFMTEEKAYFPLLDFSDARMSAANNFLGDTVTYLDARVTNKGAKVVRRLDVQLEFVDTLNQVVLRETAHPIGDRTPPLMPGQTRAFRVTFEHMPIDWDQAPPRMTPNLVRF